MAYSKTFLLLGLVLVFVLVISSEVSARELAEKQSTETNGVEDTYHGHGRPGYNYGHGHGHGKGKGKGHHCHHPPCHGAAETQGEETETTQN